MKINLKKNNHSLNLTTLSLQIKFFALIFSSLLFGVLLAISDFPKFLKANFILCKCPDTLNSLFENNNLESLQIDIKIKHLNKIRRKRDEALFLNRLYSNDKDFVPAKISFQGNAIDCKLRLKGDLPDHWAGDKWSYRIKVSKGKNIYGMSRFSLQRPGTRQDTGQWLFLHSLRMEGLLAVDYKFVNLTINGKKEGVYALEEHFSKELLESQKRREGVIVSFEEYRYWNNHHTEQTENATTRIYSTSEVESSNNKSIRNSLFLSKQKVIALNLLRGFQEKKLSADQVFDPYSLGKFLALCRLWNAEHTLFIHNINFYLNPITCRLEPIGYDGMPGFSTDAPFCYFTGGKGSIIWVNDALRSPEIARSYLKYLKQFSHDSYLGKLKHHFQNEENHLRRLLLRNLLFENSAVIWSSNYTIYTPNLWEIISSRMDSIRNELNEQKLAFVNAKLSLQKVQGNLRGSSRNIFNKSL
jgi:hypothetical protein